MPLDPTISLHAGEGMAPPPANPLSMIENIAGVQEKLNNIKLFNQTFQARQRAGEILASSPDLDSGIAELQKDPVTSAFAPELAASAAGTYNVMTQQRGQVQSQGFDAFHQFIGGFPAVIQNPGQWPALVDSILALTAPANRPQLAKSMNYLRSSLMDGLPDDPAAAQKEMTKRLAGWSIAAGAGDAIPRILGTPGAAAVGGATVPTITTPAQGGTGGEAPGTIIPVGAQQATGSEATGGQTGDTFTTSTGKELKIGSSPTMGRGLMGQNALSPAQQTAATARMKDWNETERHAFENAQLTQGLLAQMSSDFDQMAKAGGLLTPGTGAGFRTNFAKMVNTLYQAVEPDGQKAPPFDPLAIGSAENLVKSTRTMGLSVLTTMLGNQREAAQTIHDITQAVPAINNTYLGGKILIDTIGAATQRAIDRRNFENQWQAKNQGNLQGADEAFNKQAPMTDYSEAVLSKYGIGQGGFKSPEDVKHALVQGFLTKPQALEILKDQFGAKPKGR